MQDPSEEMMNPVIVRPFAQHLAVQYFRLSQLSGSMTRESQGKSILADTLYDHVIYRVASFKKKRLSSHGREAPRPKSISHGLPYTQTGWLHGIAL